MWRHVISFRYAQNICEDVPEHWKQISQLFFPHWFMLIFVQRSHSWARLHSVMTNMTQILFYVITAITFHYWMLYNYIFLWSLEGKGSAKLKKDYKSVFSKWNWRSRNLSNSRCQTILTNSHVYQQVCKIFRWGMAWPSLICNIIFSTLLHTFSFTFLPRILHPFLHTNPL